MAAQHLEHERSWAHILGWPAIIGLRSLGALIAERLAQRSFRRRTDYRGTHRWIAFPKDLRLSSQRVAATFSARRVTTPWSPDPPPRSTAASLGAGSATTYSSEECTLAALSAMRSLAQEIRLYAGAKAQRTAFGTFSARAACIYPHWVIPMLGGGPDGHTPPVTRRVSELERPQCNCPVLGPFLYGDAP